MTKASNHFIDPFSLHVHMKSTMILICCLLHVLYLLSVLSPGYNSVLFSALLTGAGDLGEFT